MSNEIPDHIWHKRRLKQLNRFRILFEEKYSSSNTYTPLYPDRCGDSSFNTNRDRGSLIYYESYDAVFIVGEPFLYQIKPGPPHQWRDFQTYTKEIADTTILIPGTDAAGVIISNQSCSQRVICVSEQAIVGKDKLIWMDISHSKYNEYFFQFMAETLLKVQNELNEIREKMEILWYAPGMPGTLGSQANFEANSISMNRAKEVEENIECLL